MLFQTSMRLSGSLAAFSKMQKTQLLEIDRRESLELNRFSAACRHDDQSETDGKSARRVVAWRNCDDNRGRRLVESWKLPLMVGRGGLADNEGPVKTSLKRHASVLKSPSAHHSRERERERESGEKQREGTGWRAERFGNAVAAEAFTGWTRTREGGRKPGKSFVRSGIILSRGLQTDSSSRRRAFTGRHSTMTTTMSRGIEIPTRVSIAPPMKSVLSSLSRGGSLLMIGDRRSDRKRRDSTREARDSRRGVARRWSWGFESLSFVACMLCRVATIASQSGYIVCRGIVGCTCAILFANIGTPIYKATRWPKIG